MIYRLEDPRTEIHVGDCLKVLSTLPDGGFDLGFALPSFDFGPGYDNWDDLMVRNTYIEFTRQWLDCLAAKLSSRGSAFILAPDETASCIDVHATEKLGLMRINWLIWHYRIGQHQESRFVRSKAHLLYYARNDSRIWHPEAILEGSPEPRMPLDVWQGDSFGRLRGKRCPDHPSQVPEKVLERILRACTEPDSWVLDPFLGSGTTCVVARSIGLRSIGIACSHDCAQFAYARVQRGGASDGLNSV